MTEEPLKESITDPLKEELPKVDKPIFSSDKVSLKELEEVVAKRDKMLNDALAYDEESKKCDRESLVAQDTSSIMQAQMQALDNYIDQFSDTERFHPGSQAEMTARHFRQCLEIQIRATDKFRYDRIEASHQIKEISKAVKLDVQKYDTALAKVAIDSTKE